MTSWPSVTACLVPTGSSTSPASTKASPPTIFTRPLIRFIDGEPMKVATKQIGGIVIEFERRADLLDAAVL